MSEVTKHTVTEFLKLSFESTVKSYSQVFFSDNKLFGIILLLVSFFDIWAGLSGLLSILCTNLLAYYLGFSRLRVENGYYGYNSLLVGLGVGLNYIPGLELLIIVVVASIFTMFITIVIEGVLAKYYLPILSVPFLFGLWLVILSTRGLSELGLSERGIYTVNELYVLGGSTMVGIYNWFMNLAIPEFISTYLLSLGAIFFQSNIMAGILIAIGLFFYSRISFLFSITGFSVAFLFYKFLGADIGFYGYTFIGFNYILTAIAIGGHFLVTSRHTFLWVVLLLPVVVLLSLGLSKLFMPYQLSIYSLPFNIVVLLFLYSLKLRYFPKAGLGEVVLQLNNPERNLYYHQQALKRYRWLEFFPASLPFFGEWHVSQAHNDTITHTGEWGNAWDFVILDKNGSQFKHSGDNLEDYYCYNKAIIAPAYGVVVDIVDGIEDNRVGEVNLIQNWGNTIVIKHTDSLYSQISHIKPGSFKVKKGTYVNKGEILAYCGNSGRSPYPHIHYQLQAAPFIGSKTLSYPIDHYIKKQGEEFILKSYEIPEKDNQLSNIEANIILKEGFNLIPGQNLKFTVKRNGNHLVDVSWEVKTDSYNNAFIHCGKTDSYIYFYNDSSTIMFKNFVGDKKSALYVFYLAVYNVPFGYYKGLIVEDSFPLNLVFKKYLLYLQDIVAPFLLFLKSRYLMEFISIDNELAPSKIEIRSKVELIFIKRLVSNTEFNVEIDKKGLVKIESSNGYSISRTKISD